MAGPTCRSSATVVGRSPQCLMLEPLQLPVQRGAADAEGLGGRRNIAAGARAAPAAAPRADRRRDDHVRCRRRADRPRAPAATPGPARSRAPRARTGSHRSRDRLRRPRRGHPTGRPVLASARCGHGQTRGETDRLRYAWPPLRRQRDQIGEGVGAVGAAGGDIEHAGKGRLVVVDRDGRAAQQRVAREEMLVASIVSGRCSTTQVPMPLVPSCSSLQSAPVHRPHHLNVASSADAPRRSTSTPSPSASSTQQPAAPTADRAGRWRLARQRAAVQCARGPVAVRPRSAAAAGRGRRDRDDAIATNGATRPRARTEPPGLMRWRLRHAPRDAGALTHPPPFPPESSLGGASHNPIDLRQPSAASRLDKQCAPHRAGVKAAGRAELYDFRNNRGGFRAPFRMRRRAASSAGSSYRDRAD